MTTTTTRPPIAREVGLLAVVLIWGVNFAVIKVPLEVLPPFVVNLARFAVSLSVLGALHVRQARRRGLPITSTFRVGHWEVVGLGLLGILIYQAGFIVGVDRVTAGMGALLIGASPLWTAVSAHALGVERLGLLGWAGTAVSLVGVVLVVVGRPGELGGDAVGVALMLGASVAWGVYTTLARPLLDRGASALGLTFWGIVVSLPGLVALALPDLLAADWGATDAWDWLAILYSGGLSTGVAYGIWNASVQAVGPSRTAAFSNLVPFVGIAAGAVLLGEPVQALQIAGGVAIVAGVLIVRRS
ncbi:DMT family transporter [Rubrivirga sp. S365]|uniref:DMT family transporter n=1 Tax=Rubrivirga litoralis TaxID=3075598 RepID=A0ABU3BUP4_9BACT|nr:MULTISPECIES: DMT family transporter [unclassified Rubrivirga]MDT0633013.1 DMT family transporter [Rubrivirga sp. F394]MDT7856924.1 DMT family transporter [Rubrivirga sp. S365]